MDDDDDDMGGGGVVVLDEAELGMFDVDRFKVVELFRSRQLHISPKSPSFAIPSKDINILSGFISKCKRS